jgi:Fic family protein
MWIHEHKNWPKFNWNAEALAGKLANVRYLQGRLLGKMENLGFELGKQASLIIITQDIVNSSAIEGENLNVEEVRSSVAKRLGIDIGGLAKISQSVDGVVEMMLDASQEYFKPLTKQRLWSWHAALFPNGRSGMHFIKVGDWRTADSGPMQVVSGPIGKEKVHFEAPAADRLELEMDLFLQWFESNNNLDPILKAAVAHLWFVTIHPFEDGNGRIARAIGDMALARADSTQNRFYSISKQIASERKSYYEQLERQQRSSPEITAWLQWFLECLERALNNAEHILSAVLFKAKLWQKLNQKSANERQRKVIDIMLDDNFVGNINTSKYAKLAKCSNDSALRDIQELKVWGILIQNPGSGRSTSYSLSN